MKTHFLSLLEEVAVFKLAPLQILQIVEILGASAGGLVALEVFKPDQGDANAVQLRIDTVGVAVVEGDAVDSGMDFEAHGWDSDAEDFIRLEEALFVDFRDDESEPAKGVDHFPCVIAADPYQNVEIAGRARVAVKTDRIPSDDQVFNFGLVQRTQEFFEVGW